MAWQTDTKSNDYINNDYREVPSTQIDDMTIISKGTKITGDMILESDLEVSGIVIGKVESNQRVSIHGTIEGNIHTYDLEANDAMIKGDVKCEGDASIGKDAIISGNLEVNNMICGGRIKGDIKVEKALKLEETAGISGDISAADIEINRGAIVQGKMEIRQEIFFDIDD